MKLTTIHSAKGLDFDIVILVHVSEGTIPGAYHGDREQADEQEFFDSERQVLYVGMSRARYMLHMTCTEPRSRFLCEPYSTAYETNGPAALATVAADDPDMEEMINLDDFDDPPF